MGGGPLIKIVIESSFRRLFRQAVPGRLPLAMLSNSPRERQANRTQAASLDLLISDFLISGRVADPGTNVGEWTVASVPSKGRRRTFVDQECRGDSFRPIRVGGSL